MGLKLLLSASGALVALTSVIFGYGTLHGSVSANADGIGKMDERLTKVEDRTGDIRERLRGIEVIQHQQTKTLEDILKAVREAKQR